MRSTVKRVSFIALDAATIVLITLSAILGLFSGDGALWLSNFGRFIYFTIDSNVLAALALLAALPFKIRRLKDGKPLPFAVSLLCLTGACAVAITFLTVVVFLGRVYGYGMMYAGNNLFLHLICPIGVMLSFVFDCECGKSISPAYAALGVSPVAIYGTVYFIMVIGIGKENGGWQDFYAFNAGGRWYVSVIVMLAAAYVTSLLLCAVQAAVFRLKKSKTKIS